MFSVTLYYDGRNEQYENELNIIHPIFKIIPGQKTRVIWFFNSENEADSFGQRLVQHRKFGSTVKVNYVKPIHPSKLYTKGTGCL